MQAFGHSTRHSQSPWIVYNSLKGDHALPLRVICDQLGHEDPVRQILLFSQLLRTLNIQPRLH